MVVNEPAFILRLLPGGVVATYVDSSWLPCAYVGYQIT